MHDAFSVRGKKSDPERVCTKPVTRGEEPPHRKIFSPPGKMCWTWFKIIGHSLKNLGPSHETLCSLGVSSWLRAWPAPCARGKMPKHFIEDVIFDQTTLWNLSTIKTEQNEANVPTANDGEHLSALITFKFSAKITHTP